MGGGAAVHDDLPLREVSARGCAVQAAILVGESVRVEAAASAHAASVLEQASRLRLASAAGRSPFAPIAKSAVAKAPAATWVKPTKPYYAIDEVD